MALRTVMIFPKFDNIELIDDIRKQYDPIFFSIFQKEQMM